MTFLLLLPFPKKERKKAILSTVHLSPISFSPPSVCPSDQQQIGRCDSRRLVSVKQLKGAIRFVADYLFGSSFTEQMCACVCVLLWACVCDVTAPDMLVCQLGGWLFTERHRKAREVRHTRMHTHTEHTHTCTPSLLRWLKNMHIILLACADITAIFDLFPFLPGSWCVCTQLHTYTHILYSTHTHYRKHLSIEKSLGLTLRQRPSCSHCTRARCFNGCIMLHTVWSSSLLHNVGRHQHCQWSL